VPQVAKFTNVNLTNTSESSQHQETHFCSKLYMTSCDAWW